MWLFYAVSASITFLNVWLCSDGDLAILITSIGACLGFFGTAGGMFKSGKIISALYFLLLGVINGATTLVCILYKIGIIKK